MLLSGLLLILWISLVGSAFGDQGAEPTLDATAVPEHWQELAATDLDGIRGRYVPATEVDLNAPWSVILWDERGGHSGSGNGSGSHQTQHGSNQQRQSLSTTTAR